MDWFKEHILRILRFSESKYTVGGSCELESVYVKMCLVFAMENGGFTGYWFTVLVLLVENRSFTFFQWVYWLQFSFNPSNDFGTKWSPLKWSTVVAGFQPFQPFQPHPWTAFVLGCDPGWVSATWCHMFISDIPMSGVRIAQEVQLHSLSWSSRSVWALRLPIGTNGILHRAHLGATSPCDALIRCRTWVDGGWDCSEISEFITCKPSRI